MTPKRTSPSVNGVSTTVGFRLQMTARPEGRVALRDPGWPAIELQP
jgi:hypothetical protein